MRVSTEVTCQSDPEINFTCTCNFLYRNCDLLYCKCDLLYRKCLRNRKRVACVYGVIMHAGNVGRIREKRVNTRRSGVLYTLLEYSANIPQVHYRTINARDELFYFFYNISRRYYIVNNFTQKIDVQILLISTQWRHAHDFTIAWIFKRAEVKNGQNNIQTFDAIKNKK
jgi:hypothetical protein